MSQMEHVTHAYEQLIKRFVKWAQSEPDIRAAIVIGSRARVDHPADEWSDLDIIILATHPARYWETSEWLEPIGQTWLTFVEPTVDRRGMERRVLFEGGLDVDFVPLPVEAIQQMLETGIPVEVVDVLQRGVRVLLDKDGLVASLQAAAGEQLAPQPPTQAEFLRVVHDFWYHTVWTAKHLRRGELWWAKTGCDVRLKELLRQMLEWHARALRGQSYDTWLRGRFLEKWADPRALAQLRETFAHYDEEDVWRALLVTMDLFRWLAIETAERLGHAYPSLGDEQARGLVDDMFAGRKSKELRNSL